MDKIKMVTPQPRKRMKRLLNLIQQQLDFYFSDANLRHDRFLRKEIEENEEGYVDLTVMLKFNKLKNLTADVSAIAKAVDNSEKLMLNETRTKLKRIESLPDVKSTDSQTVYVEQLPAYVDHDWLKQVFSSCGTVDYISLPRYKHNNQIKGFAFIEFSNESEAEKACLLLNTATSRKNKNKKRLSSEPKSTGRGIERSQQETSKRRRSTSFSESDSESKREHLKRRRTVSECSDESALERKRTREGSGSECWTDTKTDKYDTVYTKIKKRKHSSAETVVKKSARSDVLVDESVKLLPLEKEETWAAKVQTPSSETKMVDSGDQLPLSEGRLTSKIELSKLPEDERKKNDEKGHDENITAEDSKTSERKKKLRKHRGKKDNDTKELTVPPLYVISKNEWTNLKKQYKNIQRKEMRELKKTMRILRSEKVRQAELKERIQQTSNEKAVASEKATRKRLRPFCDQKENEASFVKKNGVGEPVTLIEDKNDPGKKAAKALFRVEGGTVCKMTTVDDTLTKKDIKAQLLTTAEVAYVDYTDGNDQGFVRFKSMEERSKALAACETSTWNFSIFELSESDEKTYFVKAEEDRRKKYEQNDKKSAMKNRKEKGRIKILKRLEKPDHVRFEE